MMEYHSTIKRKRGLVHAVARANSEDAAPSGRSRTRKNARHVCPFVEMSRTGKSMWVDSRSVVARAGEGGAGSDC